jgi:hypothetical protein
LHTSKKDKAKQLSTTKGAAKEIRRLSREGSLPS